MSTIAGAIVDWTSLGKVILYSFVGALLLTTLFTAGVLLVENDGTHRATAVSRVAGGAAFLVCLCLVIFGLSVLFDK